MKRIIIAISVLALVSAPAQAQSFLEKMKQKAEQAMSAVTGDNTGLPGSQAGDDEVDAPQAVTGEQALPPRRASTFGWDGPVTPSSAKFPIPLMNEFPAVPSAAELAHPTEANQIAYYKAIKAVTLRAEELNESTTCEDEETLMWRNKTNKMLHDMFGLTDEEIQMLDDENLPEADRKRLEDKMSKAILGDLDVDALESQAAQYEGMSEADAMAMMADRNTSALDQVFDRNAADIKKYMGVTAADMKAATRAQMRSSNPDKECPEMAALQKKSKAYQKEQAAKNPSFQKEADAFEKRMQAETREATMKASAWATWPATWAIS